MTKDSGSADGKYLIIYNFNVVKIAVKIETVSRYLSNTKKPLEKLSVAYVDKKTGKGMSISADRFLLYAKGKLSLDERDFMKSEKQG